MPDEVIHPHKGATRRECEAFCRLDPDQEGPDETRAMGHRDGIDVAKLAVRTAQRFADDRADRPEVVPRSDFGDDAAVRRVDRDLTVDDVRSHVPSRGNDGRAGLVAGRFDAEDPADHDLADLLAYGRGGNPIRPGRIIARPSAKPAGDPRGDVLIEGNHK
jgi:hypothetical protein